MASTKSAARAPALARATEAAMYADQLDDLEIEGELDQADFERSMEDAEDCDGCPDRRGCGPERPQ